MAYTINVEDCSYHCECCGSYCDTYITIKSSDSSFEEYGSLDDHFGSSNHFDPLYFLAAREGFVYDSNPIACEEAVDRYTGFVKKYSFETIYDESIQKEIVKVFDINGIEIASQDCIEFDELSNSPHDLSVFIIALRLVGVEIELSYTYEDRSVYYDDYDDEDDEISSDEDEY